MGRIKPLYDGIKLSALIVSDTHIDEKHPFPIIPKFQLFNAIIDGCLSKNRQNAFITVGDTTSRGSTNNWELTRKVFGKKSPAEKILLTVGNHDCWNDDGFEAAISNFYKYTGIITGKKLDRPYFSETINGYRFIFLGNDSDAGCEANFCDEQIEWFRNEAEKASLTGKPFFVFCHQSLNGKHGLPITFDKDENPDGPMDGGIGEKSDIIESILKQYKNVYYFSGHSHMGFAGEKKLKEKGYASIYSEDGLTLINLPSLACGNHHGENNSVGAGVCLEVYENKVVIRPRSTTMHKWITDVSICDSKPYLEKAIE